MTKHVIWDGLVDSQKETLVEWRLVFVRGLVTLQARNSGGEFTGVLLVENGMIDHTFTPNIQGIKFGPSGHMMLATEDHGTYVLNPEDEDDLPF